jgi:sigma-B regulation protein RsbU (phosphoserine phosphatase)
MAEMDFGALVEGGQQPAQTPLEEAQRALGIAGARHELVLSLFRLATQWLDEVRLLQAVLEVLEDTIRAEAGSVIMLDRQEGDLYFAAATGPVSEDIKRVRLDLHEGIVGWCMDAGRTIRINNVQAEPMWHREISEQFGFSVRSILATPVRLGQRVIGCIEMINKVGAGDTQFSVDDELLLGDAGESLSILFGLRGGPRS